MGSISGIQVPFQLGVVPGEQYQNKTIKINTAKKDVAFTTLYNRVQITVHIHANLHTARDNYVRIHYFFFVSVTNDAICNTWRERCCVI